jgi:hypothetical protein
MLFSPLVDPGTKDVEGRHAPRRSVRAGWEGNTDY